MVGAERVVIYKMSGGTNSSEPWGNENDVVTFEEMGEVSIIDRYQQNLFSFDGSQIVGTSTVSNIDPNDQIVTLHHINIHPDSVDGQTDVKIFSLRVGTTAESGANDKYFVSSHELTPDQEYTLSTVVKNSGIYGSGYQFTYDDLHVECFTRGTLILTNDGYRPIETLGKGDKIFTMDKGYQPIAWIGSKKLTKNDLKKHPNLRPVKITKGALGESVPSQDLSVSRQHRILLNSSIIERAFDRNEVLVAATKLTHIDGIDHVSDDEPVEYFHILFDQHHVIYANGTAAESLFTGVRAMENLNNEAKEEIKILFPEIYNNPDYKPTPARPIVEKGKHIRQVIVRHQKNKKSFQSPSTIS